MAARPGGKVLALAIALFAAAFAYQAYLDRESEPDDARPAPQPVTPAQAKEETAVAVPDGTYRLIPPKEGTFDEMWGGLKTLEEIYIPVFGLESLDEALKEKGIGNVKWSDLKQKLLFVQQDSQQGPMTFLAAYTDSKLFNDGVPYQPMAPLDFLAWAIRLEDCDGVYFNPRSRVCDKLIAAHGINTFGLAEIIGFLQAGDVPEGKRYHELALEADKKDAHYQTAYFWGKSRREGRPGDSWEKCELAKLRAYYALDFPGSRARAKGELNWFIQTYGPSPEAAALQKTFGP